MSLTSIRTVLDSLAARRDRFRSRPLEERPHQQHEQQSHLGHDVEGEGTYLRLETNEAVRVESGRASCDEGDWGGGGEDIGMDVESAGVVAGSEILAREPSLASGVDLLSTDGPLPPAPTSTPTPLTTEQVVTPVPTRSPAAKHPRPTSVEPPATPAPPATSPSPPLPEASTSASPAVTQKVAAASQKKKAGPPARKKRKSEISKTYKPLKRVSKGRSEFPLPNGLTARVLLRPIPPKPHLSDLPVEPKGPDNLSPRQSLVLKGLKRNKDDGNLNWTLPEPTKEAAAAFEPLASFLSTMVLEAKDPFTEPLTGTPANVALDEGVSKLDAFIYDFAVWVKGAASMKKLCGYADRPKWLNVARGAGVDVYFNARQAVLSQQNADGSWETREGPIRFSEYVGFTLGPGQIFLGQSVYFRPKGHSRQLDKVPKSLHQLVLQIVLAYLLDFPEEEENVQLHLTLLATAENVSPNVVKEELMQAEALHAAFRRAHVLQGGCMVNAGGAASEPFTTFLTKLPDSTKIADLIKSGKLPRSAAMMLEQRYGSHRTVGGLRTSRERVKKAKAAKKAEKEREKEKEKEKEREEEKEGKGKEKEAESDDSADDSDAKRAGPSRFRHATGGERAASKMLSQNVGSAWVSSDPSCKKRSAGPSSSNAPPPPPPPPHPPSAESSSSSSTSSDDSSSFSPDGADSSPSDDDNNGSDDGDGSSSDDAGSASDDDAHSGGVVGRRRLGQPSAAGRARMGRGKKVPWSDLDDSRLRKFKKNKMLNREAAEALGRTEHATNRRISLLKKWKQWF